MKDFLTTTTILLSFLIGTRGVTGSGGGKKGDPCRRDPDCDQQNLIGCDRNSGKCACPTHFPLHYSPAEGKCVSFVHGICTYVKSPSLPPINCIENSVCVKPRDPLEVNGKCECKKGYEKTIGGTCLPSVSGGKGGGGIETSRSKGGASASSSTHRKYPEPYHSMSTASSAQFSFSLLPFLTLFLILPNFYPVH